ncbi:unnamed protein product [Zymoseptoria tritici ST99CH_3D7]|uniref:Swt1-like HEPN domain-containing protein n=1 Tax=Zymoseptoria tritici (strain ST99CH_3D7) TaxID=1276538 RepID=A0A1X7S969_ZYMT9|nr:unnamed protein product [Zymoseptoria tritici ST99CH_3D7]
MPANRSLPSFTKALERIKPSSASIRKIRKNTPQNSPSHDSGWDHGTGPALPPWNDPDLAESDRDKAKVFDLTQEIVRLKQEVRKLKTAQNKSAGNEPSSLPAGGEGEDPNPDAKFIGELTDDDFSRRQQEREEAAELEKASLLADRQAREALTSHRKLAKRSPKASRVYIPTITMRYLIEEAYYLTQKCIYKFGRRIDPLKYLIEWNFRGDVKIEREKLRYLFGEKGVYTENSSPTVKNQWRDLIESLVDLRNAWAHPGELHMPWASDPNILDIHLAAVEELASLVGDTRVEYRAWRGRMEVQRLAEAVYGDISALLAYSQETGQDVQWDMHHQRLFDYAIHSKKSSNSTEFWDELPQILQTAAEDWDYTYSGTIMPCRSE